MPGEGLNLPGRPPYRGTPGFHVKDADGVSRVVIPWYTRDGKDAQAIMDVVVRAMNEAVRPLGRRKDAE